MAAAAVTAIITKAVATSSSTVTISKPTVVAFTSTVTTTLKNARLTAFKESSLIVIVMALAEITENLYM